MMLIITYKKYGITCDTTNMIIFAVIAIAVIEGASRFKNFTEEGGYRCRGYRMLYNLFYTVIITTNCPSAGSGRRKNLFSVT